MATEEKLNFDDISFDDVLGGEGLETTTVSEDKVTAEEPVKETKDETTTTTTTPESVPSEAKSDELDDDAEKAEDKKDETALEGLTETSNKETIEDTGTDEAGETIVGEVLTKLGFETEESYEDTSEGLVKMTKDIGQQLAQEQLSELMEQFPLVKDHLQYVVNGGESKNFMAAYDPRQDYGSLKLNEKDSSMQRMLLSNYFKMKGHDDAFVKDMIEDYKDAGKLYSKAQLAHKSLTEAQNVERQKLIEQQQESAKAAQEEQNKFWDGVYNTIQESKEFSGIQIPEREKKKFFNYLIKPVNKEGSTQRDVDHYDASMETKLAIDYLMYKGFKLDEIIKNKVGTSKARDLKSRIQKQQDKVKSAKGAPKRKTGFDIDELDLSFGV